MDKKEGYIGIKAKGESEILVEKSKFIGWAVPVRQLHEVDAHLQAVRKAHFNARHVCYAYRVAIEGKIEMRWSDDGEPSRTAGFPIWQMLVARDIVDVLVIVVRYFGGIKLGTGGLTRAYNECAKLALEDAQVVEIFPEATFYETLPYRLVPILEHQLEAHPGLKILDKEFGAEVRMKLSVPYKDLAQTREFLGALLQVDPSFIALDVVEEGDG